MSSQKDGRATNHTGEIMSLGFAFGICVILFVAVCVICSRHQGRVAAARTAAAVSARHEQPLRTITAATGSGLGKAEIASLPTFAYRCPVESGGGSCSRAGDAAAAQCVVCLTAMAEGERVRMLLGCRHIFHVDCVDMWLLSHSTCPVCRADAKPPLPPPPPAKSPASPPAIPV